MSEVQSEMNTSEGDAQPAGHDAGNPPRGKSGNRNKQSRAQEGGEDRRRRRPGSNERKGSNGYLDGIERAYCIHARSAPAKGFPVQFRTGVATLAPVVVGRRDRSILYCDCPDHVDHIWPDGEIAEDPVG